MMSFLDKLADIIGDGRADKVKAKINAEYVAKANRWANAGHPRSHYHDMQPRDCRCGCSAFECTKCWLIWSP